MPLKWKELRSLQARRVVLELRAHFNTQLANSGFIPNWTVNFNPQDNLLNSQQSVDSTITHRRQQALDNLRTLATLNRLEATRVATQAEAALAGLRVHYNNPNAIGFDLNQALDAIQTLTQRSKEVEWRELSRRWQGIKAAPEGALWLNIPPSFPRPPNAIPQQPASTNTQDTPSSQPQTQDFPARRGTQPTQRRGNRGRGTRYTPRQFQNRPPQNQSAGGRGRGRGYNRGNQTPRLSNREINRAVAEFRNRLRGGR